jgi:threonine/homoserine efflux transporter RhtA
MIGSRQNIGHAMFISAGMLWACYIVAMRKAGLEGLHAAAIAAVGSLITYVPVYATIFGTSLFNAPWRDLALQAFVHGLLVAVISFFFIGRAVSILGASNGSACREARAETVPRLRRPGRSSLLTRRWRERTSHQ